MAKIKSGILGPLSGKLGPIIGSTWKGIPCVKEVSKKPKRESSPAQLASRKKLKFINNYLVPFHQYLTVGFANDAPQRTEISAAISRNYHDAFPWENDEIKVELAKFRISIGSLRMVSDFYATASEQVVNFSWKENYGKGAKFNDQLMIVLYSPEGEIADGCTGGPSRAHKEWQLKYDSELAGKLVHVFVSVTSVNRKLIADSMYFGTLQL